MSLDCVRPNERVDIDLDDRDVSAEELSRLIRDEKPAEPPPRPQNDRCVWLS